MRKQGKELYEFGPFRRDSAARVLLRDNQPVRLQLKAIETLLVLVRTSQKVVLKDDTYGSSALHLSRALVWGLRRQPEIHADRDRKLEAARQQRQIHRPSAS